MKQILPNGPRTSKFLQLLNFGKDSIKMLSECHKTYGTRFTLNLQWQPPYVIISDPKDLKIVFMEHSETLDAGAANGTILKPILGSNSLIILNGGQHLFHRKLMLPPFHGERMKLYGKTMQDITMARISDWQIGDKLSIYNEALTITFDIILDKVFGIEHNNKNYLKIKDPLEKLMLAIGSAFGLITLLFKNLQINLGKLTPWAEIQRLKIEVDNLLLEEIESRMASDILSKTDILSLLIQAKDENGDGLSKEEIKDEMLTLLITGHQTTASTIAWSMYYILSDQSVLTKMKDEINSNISNMKEMHLNIQKLPYMDMVVNESLRIKPVIPFFGRLTTTDFQLNDITIPKGVMIYPAVYLVHHDEQYWPNPEKFIPERFTDSTKMEPYTFVPFGGGIRRCIGASFAVYEIKIILATMLMTTEMKLDEGYQPKCMRGSAIIVPSGGVPVTIVEKNKTC